MATGGSTYYYHYDSIGSVTNVTSSTGASQWTEAYEPFGSIRTETKNATSAPGNFLKYVGEYQDATGLYYLRARQYDPTSGRFAQIDPAVPERTSPYLSTYLYVGDRPTVMVDPSGKGSLFADNSSQTRNLEATSPDSLTYGINCALPLSDGPLRNARVVFTLAKLAGLSSARAREMVAADQP